MLSVRSTAGLITLSAILQIVIFPVAAPLPFWRAQLAFIALVPWLYVLSQVASSARRPLLRCALWSYLCGVLWYAGHCYWIFQTMHQYGGLSAAMSALVLGLFCLYLALYHALFGWLAAVLLQQGRAAPQAFGFAALWVAVEYARAHITSFPWDLLGYSQIDNAALTRIGPIGGIYAVSFVVALINGLLTIGMPHRLKLPLARRDLRVGIAGFALALLLIVLGMCLHAPLPRATDTAVLVQPDLPAGAEQDANAPALTSRLAALTLDAVQRLKGQGATVPIVLWPEAPTSYELQEPAFQSTMGMLSAQTGAAIVVDANAVIPDHAQRRGYRLYNAAGLFTATGLHGRYDKRRLVPFGEFVPYADLFSFAGGLTQQVGSFDRGTRSAPLTDRQHSWGTFICYESIFPDEVRELVLHGADVLVNLSDDGWYGDTSAPFQHSNMARFRAIENRRWLLRDTNTGITESIDPFGNVRASAPRHQRLAAAMPFAYARELTFYTRHGDWFAWLCVAGSVLALIAVLRID